MTKSSADAGELPVDVFDVGEIATAEIRRPAFLRSAVSDRIELVEDDVADRDCQRRERIGGEVRGEEATEQDGTACGSDRGIGAVGVIDEGGVVVDDFV